MINKNTLPYIVGAALALLVGLDYLLLGGEVIFEEQIKATRSEPLTIELDRIAEEHTLILRTGGKIPLEWRLLGPEGAEILRDHDIRTKEGVRRSSFTPYREGSYKLYASYRGGGGSEWSVIHVSVLVGDNRTISAWLDI